MAPMNAMSSFTAAPCRQSLASAAATPADLFHRMFEVKLARTAEERGLCQRIRHQVGRLEQGWAREVETRLGREVDSFDIRAEHVLLSFRETGQPIGTVRLILPDLASATSPDLPIQALDTSPLAVEPKLPLARLGEMSPFLVSQEFRRRQGESSHADAGWVPDERRIQQLALRALPNISLGLIRGVFMAAREHALTHLCATMEPTLIKLMARIGIHFVALGPARNYHGLRQPCYCSIADVDRAMRRHRPELHAIIFRH